MKTRVVVTTINEGVNMTKQVFSKNKDFPKESTTGQKEALKDRETILHFPLKNEPLHNLDLDKRDQRVIQLYDFGLSSYKIAEKLNINRRTVTKILKDNDIEVRTNTDYNAMKHDLVEKLFIHGKKKEEIADLLDLTPYTVRKVLEDRKLIFTVQENDIVNICRYIQMKKKGYDNDSIANFLDMTTKQLNRLIRNTGIHIPTVRRKTEKIECLTDIVIQHIKGKNAKEIALNYKLELVFVTDILTDLGLYYHRSAVPLE